MQITLSQAAQSLLDALAAAMPYAPHRAEFDIVADAADDLRAALKREEEAPTQETDMSTLREAAQQALEALRGYRREIGCHQSCDAERGLESALAQQEQEPVAWRWVPSKVWHDYVLSDDPEQAKLAREYGIEVQCLYTHPPRREWQSLTDENIALIDWEKLRTRKDAVRAIEAALKEKNNG